MMTRLIGVLGAVLLCMAGTTTLAQSVPDLRQRAMQGDAKAMVMLAEHFQFGDGVPRSDDSSIYWVTKAAGTGNEEATFLLGVHKCSQIYAAKEYTAGMALLNQSADSGNANAMMKLYEIWTDKTSDDESAKYNSPTKGFAYLRRAAEAGLPEAMHLTGEAYANARGVARSDSAALHWFTLGTQAHYLPSQLRVADFQLEGRAAKQPDYWGALENYKAVRYDPASGTDAKALAEIGIHRVDQVIKRAHNLQLQGQPMMPGQVLEYRLRD